MQGKGESDEDNIKARMARFTIKGDQWIFEESETIGLVKAPAYKLDILEF